jgi:hypothetical protein
MKNRDLIISNLRESISSLETIIEGLKTGFVFGRTRPVSAFSQRQQWVGSCLSRMTANDPKRTVANA